MYGIWGNLNTWSKTIVHCTYCDESILTKNVEYLDYTNKYIYCCKECKQADMRGSESTWHGIMTAYQDMIVGN